MLTCHVNLNLMFDWRIVCYGPGYNIFLQLCRTVKTQRGLKLLCFFDIKKIIIIIEEDTPTALEVILRFDRRNETRTKTNNLSRKIPRNARVTSAKKLETPNKNKLGGITFGIRPLWGIHSLALIIHLIADSISFPSCLRSGLIHLFSKLLRSKGLNSSLPNPKRVRTLRGILRFKGSKLNSEYRPVILLLPSNSENCFLRLLLFFFFHV